MENIMKVSYKLEKRNSQDKRGKQSREAVI